MNKISLIDKFHHWRRKLRWNRQYKKGKWEYLNNEREAARYTKIIDYINTYAVSKPTILDLGAGEAVLNEKLDPEQYAAFHNLDYSSASIKKAEQKQLKNAVNIVADIHTFSPDDLFDVIVFNEAFYYVHDHLKIEVLNRFIDKLAPDGILIMSIYKEGVGCWNLLEESTTIKQLNFETVTTDREGTYWKVGVYKKV